MVEQEELSVANRILKEEAEKKWKLLEEKGNLEAQLWQFNSQLKNVKSLNLDLILGVEELEEQKVKNKELQEVTKNKMAFHSWMTAMAPFPPKDHLSGATPRIQRA